MRKNHIYLLFLLFLPFQAYLQGLIIPSNFNFGVTSGSSVFLNEGFDLVVESGESGTGSLIDMNSSNSILFSGGGEARIEMYLSADDWHYISSPIAAGTSGLFWGIYLKQFSEPDSTWFYIIASDSVLNPMQGYAVWSSSESTGDTIITFGGLLNAGPYTRHLTKSGSALHESKGFNFIGNPYASAINWQVGDEGWTRTNLDPIIYLWNPTAGQYGSYNRNNRVGSNDVDSIIPSKQGFFVHVTNNGTGSVSVNNNARIHYHKTLYKTGKDNNLPQLLRLKATGNGLSDESIIGFDENATPGYDVTYDAFKLIGKQEAPQLFTKTGETKLAVNILNSIDENIVIPLFFKAGESGEYQIKANNLDSFDDIIPLWLEDIKDSYFQNLRENPTYIFYSDTGDNVDRFRIHFSDPMDVDEIEWQQALHVYSENQNLHINLKDGQIGDIRICNLLGQNIKTINAASGENIIYVGQENTILLVVIQTGKGIFTKKILAE